MTPPFNFTCPYCGRDVTIEHSRYSWNRIEPSSAGGYGTRGFALETIVCPNPKCNLETVTVSEFSAQWNGRGHMNYALPPLQTWRLHPSSYAKSLSYEIPQAIRSDYYEACAIETLSPKASATLSRRALQGIMRDFFGAQGRTLFAEIKIVEESGKLDPDVIAALDSVREVGNIGAHMEKDIDVIIDVDPNEARILIELIELLLDETYIRERDRKQRLADARALAALKNRARKEALPEVDTTLSASAQRELEGHLHRMSRAKLSDPKVARQILDAVRAGATHAAAAKAAGIGRPVLVRTL